MGNTFTGLFFAAAATVGLPLTAWAQSNEAVAIITELKFNRGEIQIKLPGKTALEKPSVLQSLYPGTVLQASKDASAVILYTEGMKTVIIDEKNSPLQIRAPEARAGQTGAGLKQMASFLLGKKKPATYVPLATRGQLQPPTLLSPRNTKLLTDSPTLQWMGMERQTGTVRLYGPGGLLWSAENIALTQIKYPVSAPKLQPGIEYSWALEKKGFAAERANFRILTSEEAKGIQEQLSLLQREGGLAKTTAAVLRASFLVGNELYHEAREVLSEAINDDPDEPTLHFLLGEINEKTGLKNLAMEEYNEAEFLLKMK